LGDESCGDGPNDPIGQCRDHWWLRFIGYVKRNIDKRAAKKQQEKPADKAARVTATATKWMAFFTFVLCLSSIATIYVLKNQLAEMRATERPWLSIDTGRLTGFGFQDDVGAYAAFDLGVSATGQTPALHIRALGRLITNFTNPAQQSRAVCDEVEKEVLRDVTIFPSQKGVLVRASAIWDEDPKKRSMRGSGTFEVVGCVAYTDAFGNPHHTGFTFDLYGVDPSHPDLEMPIQVVPFGAKGQVAMSPNWSGFTTFAD
jgi:hypothetical protein